MAIMTGGQPSMGTALPGEGSIIVDMAADAKRSVFPDVFVGTITRISTDEQTDDEKWKEDYAEWFEMLPIGSDAIFHGSKPSMREDFVKKEHHKHGKQSDDKSERSPSDFKSNPMLFTLVHRGILWW